MRPVARRPRISPFGVAQQPVQASGDMAQMKRHRRQAARTRIDLFIAQAAAPALQVFSASSSACMTARCTAGISCNVPRSQGSGVPVPDIDPPRRPISLSATTNHVGTAAPGCPAERSSALALPEETSRAALDRTAGAAVPTWVDCTTMLGGVGQSAHGPVAQLDRALRFERRGWEFKSLRVHHSFLIRVNPRKSAAAFPLTASPTPHRL